MKKPILLNLLFIFCIINANAQISISTSDLPHANDTFRVSTAQQPSGIDVSLTGPSYSWDFSQLMPVSQKVDSFIDEAATSSIFSIVFVDISLNSNRANQATIGGDFALGTLINLSGVYNFYYNSSASYKQVGFGANVNGIPLPITYSPHDIIYKLPLQYPSLDSSASGYSVDLASTLGVYYKANKTRKNEVDGWGTLTTSFGTFDVLRVHSTVVEKDSLYLDTLGFGFNLPTITTHEYKWLGAAQGIPLVQVNTNATGLVTSVLYKDSIRSLVGIEQVDKIEESLKVYPNPALTSTTIRYSLSQRAVVDMDIISSDGKIFGQVKSQTLGAGTHEIKIDFREKKMSAGNYLVRLIVHGKPYVQPLVVTPFR